MAEQKSAAPRGGKKPEKKKKKSGGQKSSGFRASEAERRARKTASVRRNLAKQRKAEADASRPARTEHGQARAMRRASVNLSTGATSNLAEVERKMHSPSPEEQRYQDAKERLVQAIFGVDADGNKVPKPPDPIDAIFEQAG